MDWHDISEWVNKNRHEIGSWIAGLTLSSIGVFAKYAFGGKKLTKIQLIALWLFCAGVVWLTNTYVKNGIIAGSIQLCSGLVAVNLINGLIKGGERAEPKISNTVEKSVENISDKVDDIADVVTRKKNDKK